ncbi:MULTISPECIES: hypothetical protein [Corynebacterium]|nr:MULTISPECIES: hypothetical protein [Corynebacterium]
MNTGQDESTQAKIPRRPTITFYALGGTHRAVAADRAMWASIIGLS